MKAELIQFSCGKWGVKIAAERYVDVVDATFTWFVGDRHFPDCKTRFKWRAERALRKHNDRYAT